MRCIVTGGAGFIGSNLVDTLVKEHDVICLDKDKNGYWNENAENHIGNICDSSMVDDLCKNVDKVFHLAAEVKIQNTINDPASCYESNVNGTVNLLEACRKNEVKSFVFSSTSAIYKNAWLIQPEDSPEYPYLNPYATSKKMSEDLCKSYAEIYNINTKILRYFNVYGNRQHENGNYAPVLGIFLKQKQEGKDLTITGDGNQTRDFVHVNDVVSANILAADCEEFSGRIYNVGSGISFSIKDIANIVSSKQIYIEERTGEIKHSRASINRIQSELKWTPKMNLKSWLEERL